MSTGHCGMRGRLRCDTLSAAAFTLTELLVVTGILALLVAARLPAMCRAKTPVQLLQCLSNCRQLGQAVLLYRSDYNDAYPYGNRVTSGGTGARSVLDPTGWPMQLLRYARSSTNTQPKVFLCPAEKGIAETWPLQLHYQANRMLLSDVDATDRPAYGAEVRRPAIYWLFIEKGPYDFATVKPGSLANPYLIAWNMGPGSPQYWRHSGGMSAAAADGHIDWLRTPPYQPNQPPPDNFGELGDSADGQYNPSTFRNGAYVKLYCRYRQTGFN